MSNITGTTITRYGVPVTLVALAMSSLIGSVFIHSSDANDEFLGNLAVIREADVANALELTDEQTTQLATLVKKREADAVELVMLPDDPSRQEAFRKESEERGLAVLTEAQRIQLDKILAQRATGSASSEAKDPEPKATEPKASEPMDPANVDPADTEPSDVKPSDVKPADVKPAGTAPSGTEPSGVVPVGAMPNGAMPVDPVSNDAVPIRTEPTDAVPTYTRPLPPPIDDHPFVARPLVGRPFVERPEPKLRFNFDSQQWRDVLLWFAEQADLSLVLDVAPPGTFNYTDDRDYTPDQAIDLLNSVLLTKGYTLVRKDRMLMVINLEDGIPPNLVRTVDLKDLDTYGDFELISVLFQLAHWTPQEAADEISQLIGPQGSVIALPKSRQVFVTETAGRLRTIRAMIEQIEAPGGETADQIQIFQMKYVLPEEVMDVVRQLLNLPEGANAMADGSLRFAIDTAGGRLLVTGRPVEMARVKAIIDTVDIPGPGLANTDVAADPPVLRVYSITTADPQSVLSVMQTLLAGVPDVRLDIDPKTGNLVAFARAAQHAMIDATLQEMQRDAQQIEVIQLNTVDPQLAVLSINKLFGAGGEKPDPSAPQVDADPISNQLLIRATSLQIEQIRALLEKMGESETPEGGLSGGGNVRMLPLQGRSAMSAIEQIQAIWPAIRRNRIRVVTPSSTISSIRPSRADTPEQPNISRPRLTPQPMQQPMQQPTPRPTIERPAPGPLGTSHSPILEKPILENSAAATLKPRIFFAVQTTQTDTAEPDATEPETTEPDATAPEATAPEAMQPEVTAPEVTAPIEATAPVNPADALAELAASAEIIVAPGPGGVMIASADLEALDQFESLLNAMADEALSGGPEITIFYLVHTKADAVAQTLDQILGGGTLGSSAGGGDSLVGDMAGGILGAMLGGGGGGGGGFLAPTGTIQITPDTRLNALIVQAGDADVDLIEQLLKVLDQRESPEEILVASRAEMIPIYNTQASEIADIVKEVYQDRMVTGSGGGGGRPDPEQLMQMLRGGRGGGSSRNSTEDDVQKMSVSVDLRTNALVVAAPEQLFLEVKQLVEQLDLAAGEVSNETVRTVTLHRVNADTVQEALGALMGESVQFSNSSRAGSSGSSRRSTSGGSPPGSSDADSARRAMFMQMMMQRGGGPPGGGDGPPGGGGGPPGGGFFRGGPPGGSGAPGGGGPPGGSSRGGRSR